MKSRPVNNVPLPWWLFVFFSGTFMVLVGIWVLITPIEAYFSLSILLAVGLVAAGLVNLMLALYLRGTVRGWFWLLAGALLDLALGIYLLYFPMLSMILLPFLIGLWLLFRGLTDIGRSTTYPIGPRKWFHSLLPGLLILLFSVFILRYPLSGMINIVSWMGLASIVSGLLRIYFSVRLYQSSTFN